MKRIFFVILLFAFAVCLFGCSHSNETAVKATFEKTPLDIIEENVDDSIEVITTTYYEMSDGTWKTDEQSYLYRSVITGKLPNASVDTTYTILSNIEDISFKQAWKASGLSSNLEDYFKPEDAIIVASKIGKKG